MTDFGFSRILDLPASGSFGCSGLSSRPLRLAQAVLLLVQMAASGVLLLPQAQAGPLTPVASPVRPEHFDRPTVERLIATIDQVDSANLLKFGYFMTSGRHRLMGVPERDVKIVAKPGAAGGPAPAPMADPAALPHAEAFKLLERAQGNTAVGSKRWSVLQSVRGFGLWQMGAETRMRALEVYGELFSQAVEGASIGAETGPEDEVQRAVYEFVVLLSGEWPGRQGAVGEAVQHTLHKAFIAYLSQSQTAFYPVPWLPIFRKAGNLDIFHNEVERRLYDRSTPATYNLLWAAAQSYRPSQPQRALSLLQQAKSLLPQPQSKEQRKQIHVFYQELVTLLLESKQLQPAIAAQLELVERTGQGRGRLAVLYYQNRDQWAFNEVLNTLLTPQADDEDVNLAASLLMKEWRQGGSRTAADAANTAWDEAVSVPLEETAIRLLTTYLETPRQRDVTQELEARLKLGTWWMQRQKWEQARAVLEQAPQVPLPSPTMLAESIHYLLSEVKTAQSKTPTKTTDQSKSQAPSQVVP